MAARRRAWESLSPKYRERLSRGGITKGQYESGASLSKVRGHGKTPEHGLRSANPKKHQEYIRKRLKTGAPGQPPFVHPGDEDDAYALNAARDAAYFNIYARLHTYIKYNNRTVTANVYGGVTAESGPVPGMTLVEARWTANADTEEIRGHAYTQYKGNPWFYH